MVLAKSQFGISTVFDILSLTFFRLKLDNKVEKTMMILVVELFPEHKFQKLGFVSQNS
jgi:hypothetical protein